LTIKVFYLLGHLSFLIIFHFCIFITKKGEQGNKWILGELTIPANTQYFDIIFEATKGNGIYGNIAIDDIDLVQGGTCEYFNSTTTTMQPTTLTPSIDLKCSFETDLCDWFVDQSKNIAWSRQNGQSAIYGSAPLTDVTNQNSLGYYAYVNSSTDSPLLETAILRSPTLSYTQETCLDFWYQLGGEFNSGLKVAIRNKNNITKIWERNGNGAEIWSHAYVAMPSNTLLQRWIEFEGKTKSLYHKYENFLNKFYIAFFRRCISNL
jgi:hypothetical protein